MIKSGPKGFDTGNITYLHGSAVGGEDVAHPVGARGVLAVDVEGDGAAGLVVHAPKVLLLATGRVVGPDGGKRIKIE